MNKIYKLVVTDDAAEDIENIYHFIALHSPKYDVDIIGKIMVL